MCGKVYVLYGVVRRVVGVWFGVVKRLLRREIVIW